MVFDTLLSHQSLLILVITSSCTADMSRESGVPGLLLQGKDTTEVVSEVLPLKCNKGSQW
jgi:hypothetical protein